ncbi:hypothetical protein SNE40_007276 [Patella caerulea]|uniref:Guanylate cyclase n=1 Tax=Patella caerulea TaxID=87958 RepID=A0AAN8JYH4_PATCE
MTGIFKILMCGFLTVVTLLSFQVTESRYQATICSIVVNNTFLPYDIRRSGPAIDMAIEHVQQLYNDTIEFRYLYRDGGSVCGSSVSGYSAAEVYYKDNVSVFIGPGCSLAVEAVAHMAAKWNIPIITPAGSAGILADKTQFPTLTRLSFGMQEYAAFYLDLLKLYDWNHVALFYESDDVFSGIIGNTFYEIFRSTQLLLVYYQIKGRTFTANDYRTILQKGHANARVFVLLASPNTVRKFLSVASALEYTFGDHVILATIPVNTNLDIWQRGDAEDEVVKQACQCTMFIALSEDFNLEYITFKNDIKTRALTDYGFNFGNEEPTVLVSGFYDAIVIYARILNETLTNGGDPLNGTYIFSQMNNRVFQGIGGKVSINSKGDKYTDFILYDMTIPDSGVFEVVGSYDGMTKQYIPITGKTIHWPGDKGPPPDVPECGFRSDTCASSGISDFTVIVLCVGFAVIIITAITIVGFIYRRWKRKMESDMWWWRIAKDDLDIVDKQDLNSSAISFLSKLTSLKSDAGVNMDTFIDVAMFRGIMVQLKKLDLKDVPLTKRLFAEFKEIRDVNQANIAKVFGACLDPGFKCIVIEHCSKGTLQDILGSSELTLDAHFKFSLAIDIAQGMAYIHQSTIHHHGKLSSTVCLIDNRFCVKITDVGLRYLYENLNTDIATQEYLNECLWKAPEHLRNEGLGGTKEGDRYSFSIILQEILTRESPFYMETEQLGLTEVLQKIKMSSAVPFRPSVDIPPKLTDMYKLMKQCWSEIPNQRPTFPSIVNELKSMAGKFGDSGNLLDNLLRRMELYANNLEKLVDEKTLELKEEKKRSEELLYQILPRSVAERLKRGLRIEPEAYDCVTIYFSDICGFTTISARSQPMEVVDLLNDLYSCFDSILGEFDVYKVETIGDAYMVASGLPQRNGNRHAQEIARTSLALLKAIDTFQIRHLPDEKLRLRIGLHSGPVCAGVVGVKMPRYCLFGDTVNTASRMESHGEGLKIHMSESTKTILDEHGLFHILERGEIEVKGKGFMKTFWLLNEEVNENKSSNC